MMAVNPKSKTDAMRRLAEFEASAAVETRSKLIDEHNSAFRWMIASLFALNGGAILTILGSGDIGAKSIFVAFWVFFLGIVVTFLAVISAQLSDKKMIVQMHIWGLYWVIVGVTVERDQEQEETIKAGILAAERLGRLARLQAIFAMVFFVLGILTAVVMVQKAEVADLETQLDLIEKDLMRNNLDR